MRKNWRIAMMTSDLLSQNTFPYDSCSLSPHPSQFFLTYSVSLSLSELPLTTHFPQSPSCSPSHSSLPHHSTPSLSFVLPSKLPHTTHFHSLFSPSRSTSHNSLAIPHNWSSMENMNIAFSIHSNCADLPKHQPRKGDAIKRPVFCRDPFCARL